MNTPLSQFTASLDFIAFAVGFFFSSCQNVHEKLPRFLWLIDASHEWVSFVSSGLRNWRGDRTSCLCALPYCTNANAVSRSCHRTVSVRMWRWDSNPHLSTLRPKAQWTVCSITLSPYGCSGTRHNCAQSLSTWLPFKDYFLLRTVSQEIKPWWISD